MKYGDVTLGQVEAMINKIGGLEVWEAVLHDEVTVEVKEVFQKLFDKNGRRIPRDLKSAVCDPYPSFKLVQPEINYATRLDRLGRFFPAAATFSSTKEFQTRSEALLEQLRQDKLLSNLLNGVFLPICLPKIRIKDYGQALEEVFLVAVGKSYENQFSGRKFYNYRKGELETQVSIVEDSHKRLLAEMEEGPVVGIQLFPLQGYSIYADREQMTSLPESLILSGAMDIATVITAYPDVLARENTPGYDCAANSWQSAGSSLCFGTFVGGLGFDGFGGLGDAGRGYSGGLLFLG